MVVLSLNFVTSLPLNLVASNVVAAINFVPDTHHLFLKTYRFAQVNSCIYSIALLVPCLILIFTQQLASCLSMTTALYLRINTLAFDLCLLSAPSPRYIRIEGEEEGMDAVEEFFGIIHGHFRARL